MRRRIAALVGLTLLASLILAGTPPRASACSCVGPVPAEHRIGAADVAFVGTAISTREGDRDANSIDFFADDEWTVRVERTYKGVLPPTVEFLTHNEPSGNGGGDCGGASFGPGDEIAVLANLDGDGRLRAHFGMCSPMMTETELAARGELAPPEGSGGIRSLVAIRDHDATLAALNAEREVVAYGFGASTPQAIAPCGDDRHFVTVERRWPHTLVLLWDATTMTSRVLLQLDANHLGVPWGPTADRIGCESADRVVLLTPEVEPDYGEGLDPIPAEGRRIGRGAVIEFEPPEGVVTMIPGTSTALVASETGIEQVDLFEEVLEPKESVPGELDSTITHLSVAPDGRRVVAFADDATARVIDLSTGDTRDPIAVASGSVTAAWWLDDTHLAAELEPAINDFPITIIDIEGGTVAKVHTQNRPAGSLGGGTLVNGKWWGGGGASIRSLDGTESPLLPGVWDLRAAIPFAGPEVSPEAASRVRADDIDLTETLTQDSKGSDQAATAEISVESGGGLGLVPIAVGAGTAGALLTALLALRLRRARAEARDPMTAALGAFEGDQGGDIDEVVYEP